MRLWAVASIVFIFAEEGCGAPCAHRETLGRCERLACPTGARPTAEGRCECEAGSSAALGACLPAAQREALCGVTSHPAEGGCAPKVCASGVIDGATGVCLPVGSVRSVAESMQVPLLADETLTCAGERRLVIGGNLAACVAAEACGPGARLEKKACVPERGCAAGEVSSGASCVRIVHPGEGGPLVDVAAWARAILGPDGGVGSSFLCGGFTIAPWLFTQATDVRFTLALSIDLRIPDNDVTQARARLEGFNAVTGQPVPIEPVEQVVDRLISGLRAMGGSARASAVSTHLRCLLPIGGRPMASPLPH